MRGGEISSCVELARETVFRTRFPANPPGANTYSLSLSLFSVLFGWVNLARTEGGTVGGRLGCNFHRYNYFGDRRGISRTHLNQFFRALANSGPSALLSFLLNILAPSRLYSHNMLMFSGDADITDLVEARIHRTQEAARRITIRRNCLTDRNLHFECPSGSNDDYSRRIAPLRWSVD